MQTNHECTPPTPFRVGLQSGAAQMNVRVDGAHKGQEAHQRAGRSRLPPPTQHVMSTTCLGIRMWMTATPLRVLRWHPRNGQLLVDAGPEFQQVHRCRQWRGERIHRRTSATRIRPQWVAAACRFGHLFGASWRQLIKTVRAAMQARAQCPDLSDLRPTLHPSFCVKTTTSLHLHTDVILDVYREVRIIMHYEYQRTSCGAVLLGRTVLHWGIAPGSRNRTLWTQLYRLSALVFTLAFPGCRWLALLIQNPSSLTWSERLLLSSSSGVWSTRVSVDVQSCRVAGWLAGLAGHGMLFCVNMSRYIAGLLVSTDAYMNFQVGAGKSTVTGWASFTQP